MITAAQIREARRLLGWASYRLAKRCSVTVATMAKAEQDELQVKVANSTLVKIKAALEAAGVEFMNGEPGAQLRKPGT